MKIDKVVEMCVKAGLAAAHAPSPDKWSKPPHNMVLTIGEGQFTKPFQWQNWNNLPEIDGYYVSLISYGCQFNEIALKYGFKLATMARGNGWNHGDYKYRLTYDTYIKVEIETDADRTTNKITDGELVEFWKNSSGRYDRHKTHKFKQPSDIEPILQELAKIPKPAFEHKTVDLGEPHQFKEIEPYHQKKYGDGEFTTSVGIIDNAKVIGIVSLCDDRSLSDAANPDNNNVWFNVYCRTDNAAMATRVIDFNIITNGDTWYQVEKTGKKFKATPSTKRGKFWDLANMNQFDQGLLSWAIRHYTNGVIGVKDDEN